MSQKFKKRGLTLVELVMAILLVNVIILTGLSMEMGMRKLFTGADVASDLSDEGVGTMIMVTKVINRAIGAFNITGSPMATAGSVWSISQDSNHNGKFDANDTPCAFCYFNAPPNQGQLWYCVDASNIGSPTAVLTSHCTFFSISDPLAAGKVGYSTILLSLRRNVALPANATNPELNFSSKAQYQGVSFN